MRFLFYLGHPAHYHMFRNPAAELKSRGHVVVFAVKAKDILGELLRGESIEQISMSDTGRAGGKVPMVRNLVGREFALFRLLWRRRFDLLVGTEPSIAHMGRLFRIPSLVTTEDDLAVIPLLAKITFPFAHGIVAPESCDLGKWNRKKIGYRGYQKLTYLHPKRFIPDRERVRDLVEGGRPYYLLRFSALHAHHDTGIAGFSDDLVRKVLERLKQHGDVYISSERPIPADLEPYRLKLPVSDVHHALYFANLFVSDSQSMTVEAALLGTPSIRFSDFAGRIGVLEELEHRYGLTSGFKTDQPAGLLKRVEELMSRDGLKEEFLEKRDVMLNEKIDVSDFWVWLFENYPESVDVLRRDGRYTERFS